MILKKILVVLACTSLLLVTNSFAKNDKSKKNEKYEKYENQNNQYEKKVKVKKQKKLPKGLEKKLARGGELPPGWKTKIKKGEVVDVNVLRHAKVVRSSDYSKAPYKTVGTEVYKVEDKIFKVIKATNVIIDAFDL